MNEKEALDKLAQLAVRTQVNEINSVKQCIAVLQHAFVCQKCNEEANAKPEVKDEK
jgi:hypothetical protein